MVEGAGKLHACYYKVNILYVTVTVLNTHSIGHFGEMSGDNTDYRNVNILYYSLPITPSVVIITDWLKMEVSYICGNMFMTFRGVQLNCYAFLSP